MSEFRGRELKIIIAVLLLSGSFLFFGNVKTTLAAHSYNKAYNGTLAALEWNQLQNDFVNTWQTATMTGPFAIGASAINFSKLFVFSEADQTNETSTVLELGSEIAGKQRMYFGVNNTGNYTYIGSVRGGDVYSNLILQPNSGNVGINITNPLSRLAIKGAGNASGTSALDVQGNNGISHLFVRDDGNVGIGTTTPLDLLSIGPQPSTGSNLGTGHNSTMTYSSTDNYALVNYGLLNTVVDSFIPGGTNSLWNGTSTGNIWNINSGNVGIGTTTPVSKLEIVGGPLRLTGTYLDINRIGSASSGINWYSKAANAWVNYMSSTGAGMGPKGNLTAPAGNLVTSWALRSFIESVAGYGWTFESGVIAGTAPAVKFEIRSSDGSFHSYGNGLIDGTTGITLSGAGADLAFTGTGPNTISTASGVSLALMPGGTGNVGIGTTAPSSLLHVAAKAAPATDIVNISNAGFPVTTTGVSGLQIGYTGGAGAIEASAQRTDLTPGATSGSTWNALRVTSGAAGSGVTLNGIKLEDKVAGAGTSVGLRIGTGWDYGIYSNTAGINYFASNVGIGTTTPLDLLSIGPQPSTGSNLGTGHNSTMTYSSTDNYALVNYGLLNTVANSFIPGGTNSLWNGTSTGNIWNVNSGNVGIGTTNPQFKAEVYGSGQTVANITDAGVRGDMFALNAAGSATGSGGALVFGNGQSKATSSLGWAAIKGFLTNGGSNTSGDLTFLTRNATTDTALTERMRILANGYIGIGTTNPTTILHVKAGSGSLINIQTNAIGTLATPVDRKIKWSDYVNSEAGSINLTDQQSNVMTANMIFSTKHLDGILYEDMRMSNGNVGIGTTNPGAKLNIATSGDTPEILRLFSDQEYADTSSWGTFGGYLSFFGKADSADNLAAGRIGYIVDTHAGMGGALFTSLYFETNNGASGLNRAMVIKYGGNVGIGTTTPLDLLSIGPQPSTGSNLGTGHNSTMTYSSTDNYALVNYGMLQTITAPFAPGGTNSLWNGTSTGNIWNVNSGNVGIGTTNPLAKLQVNGSVSLNADSTYNNRKIFTISRAIATGTGSWVNLGSMVSNGQGSYINIYQSNHHGGTINAAVYEILDVYYSGATTDWMQVPTSNYRSYSGVQDYAIDVRRTANHWTANLEIRARALTATPGAGTLQFEIQTNGTFIADSTSGSGATVSGYLSRTTYQFPVSNDRFKASSNGLFILNTGNVGIGTTTPLDLLSIGPQPSTGSNLGTGHNSTMTYSSTDNYALVNYGLLNTVANSFIPGGTNSLWNGTSTGNIWNVNSGNVGIGTTTPAYKLEVSGTFKVSTSSSSIILDSSGNISIGL